MKTRRFGIWAGACRDETFGLCFFHGAHHIWWWQCPMRYVYWALAVPMGLLLLVQALAWRVRYYEFLEFLRHGLST